MIDIGANLRRRLTLSVTRSYKRDARFLARAVQVQACLCICVRSPRPKCMHFEAGRYDHHGVNSLLAIYCGALSRLLSDGTSTRRQFAKIIRDRSWR